MSGREGFPEDEFGNFRLSDLSHADMFALENPGLVPVKNMSPHGQMVLHSLENPPEGDRYNHPSGLRINMDLAEAIRQERDARERENPAIVGYNPDFQDIHRSESMDISFQLLKDVYSLSQPEMEGHTDEYEKYFNEVVLPQARDEEHAKRLKFAFENKQHFYLPDSFLLNPGSSHKDRFTNEDRERRGIYRNLGRIGYGDFSDAWQKTKANYPGSVHPREFMEQNDMAEDNEVKNLLENTKPENWRKYLPKTDKQENYLTSSLQSHLDDTNWGHWLTPYGKQKLLLDASATGQLTSQGPIAELEQQRQFSDIPLITDVTPESEIQRNRVYGELRDNPLFTAGEPMHIAFQLLKRELSPEARRHKLEYDKKYESSPERVKYREELNQERRRRGIYGSGDHKDVSHTQGGRLTLEGEHSNRARHFKNRGTLRVV
tara:strand:+ start:8149 stop:9447 length:1299 start_codon:yes stop_codon:yes gene_type:complete